MLFFDTTSTGTSTAIPSRSMLVWLLFASSWIASAAKNNDKDCRLWLAPSYTSNNPDYPVFGLYAGQAFKKDEHLPLTEIAIPLVDFVNSPAADRTVQHRAVVDYLERHMWQSEYTLSKLEGNHSSSVLIPGSGVFANYHSGYTNVDLLQGSTILRSRDPFAQSTEGVAHPNRGAISHYYNMTMVATQDIPVGMELFADFGNYDEEESAYQDKISKADYETADKVLEKIMQFFSDNKKELNNDPTRKEAVLDIMLDTVLPAANGKHAKVIKSLIPDNWHKLEEASKMGTFLYRNSDIIQTLDWIHEHGQCVDNLYVKESTNPEAGRGAFARRKIAKDHVISPVPMMPLINEEVLDVYSETVEEFSEREGRKVVRFDKTKPPTGTQLLVNYCFGNQESNLLLFPAAPHVQYVNHGSGDQVNAFLQWSQHDHVFNNHDFADVRLRKWRYDELPSIAMELVAKRDIKEGEEIFIDYGEDWEEAWKMHKAQWAVSHPDGKWPLRAADVMEPYKDKPFPVDIQEGQIPYPEGVVTACVIETADDLPDGQTRTNEAGQRVLKWLAPTTYEGVSGRHIGVCDLMSRQETPEGSYNYTVVTRLELVDDQNMVEVRYVPHTAVLLVDRPYNSDLHTPDAFRRWIQLEDRRFPQAWRNLRD